MKRQRDSCVSSAVGWAFVCVCLARDHKLMKWTCHLCRCTPDININMFESRLLQPLLAPLSSHGHPQIKSASAKNLHTLPCADALIAREGPDLLRSTKVAV